MGPFDVNPEYLELERLKMAVSARVSNQMMRDVSVETWQDMIVDQLVIGLQTGVMAHKLATEDVTANYRDEVTMGFHYEPRGLAVVNFGAMLLGCVGAALSGSLWAWLIVALWALVCVVLVALNPPRDMEATRVVEGTIKVPVSSYAVFPESTMVYPEELGRARYVQMVGQPWKASYLAEDVKPPTPRPELPMVADLAGYDTAWDRMPYIVEHMLRLNAYGIEQGELDRQVERFMGRMAEERGRGKHEHMRQQGRL